MLLLSRVYAHKYVTCTRHAAQLLRQCGQPCLPTLTTVLLDPAYAVAAPLVNNVSLTFALALEDMHPHVS